MAIDFLGRKHRLSSDGLRPVDGKKTDVNGGLIFGGDPDWMAVTAAAQNTRGGKSSSRYEKPGPGALSQTAPGVVHTCCIVTRYVLECRFRRELQVPNPEH
jgi:hypothetical protein